MRYSLNQKQALCEFLDYGDVPISNNLAEKAIRPFMVGRKNWLFCDSVKGAEASAIVYSLVETAKANRIEPYEYLLLVLTMLPYLGKSPALEELEKLMPWHPKVAPGAYTKMMNGRVLRKRLCRDFYGWVIIEHLRKGYQSFLFFVQSVDEENLRVKYSFVTNVNDARRAERSSCRCCLD